MQRYLVFYYNGLVETNVLITANSEEEAMQYVDESIREDENFQKNHCFGNDCHVVSAKEL